MEVFVFIVLVWILISWARKSRIDELHEKVERLNSQVTWLMSVVSKEAPVKKGIPITPAIQRIPTPPIPVERIPEPLPVQHAAPSIATTPIAQAAPKPSVRAEAKKRLSFEQQFGARLPVWIGGIALALAGFYMVKYSIETGLLSPSVRLALGALFGIGLLGAARWMRDKGGIANGTRIAQALAGAGIADLYICVFAAASLYHLIPSPIGFIGMAAVTAAAVLLSLRHGAPIAMLGMVGGFLTPALVGSNEPNALLLFAYIYVILTGLFTIIRRQNWWFLALPTVIGAFLWVLLWMSTSFQPGDGIWLSLFLIAISSTVTMQARDAVENGATTNSKTLNLPTALNYLTLGGAVILMSMVTVKSGYGVMEWGLFGLLAAGGMVLAYFRPAIYGFVPLLSMAVNGALLFTAGGIEPAMLGSMMGLFALLYCGGGYYALWHSRRPVLWAKLIGATSLGYYLIAYYRLHAYLSFHTPDGPVWGIAAMIFAVLALQTVKSIMQKFDGCDAEKQRLLAIFVLTATAFISLGLTIELRWEFLSLAFAAQLLAVSWVNTKVDIKALRTLAKLLAGVFALLLAPQALLVFESIISSLLGGHLHYVSRYSVIEWPLLQLGVPALLFIGSSIFLRMEKDDRLVKILESAAVLMGSVMAYLLLRNAFHQGENLSYATASFVERGIITNALFVYGLACLWAGRRFSRQAVSQSAMLVCAAALARITYFDFFLHNPIWSHQSVGAVPFFNGLLLPYGLPAIWLMHANRELRALGKERYLRYSSAFLLALVFAFVSLNVRQLYHGEYLDAAITGNAEVYTYSVVWLLLGVALLVFGTLRQDRMIRIASLAVMILTVGKVFLYDASALTGLYRVFSFLGLGLSLMALSWFYNRFVLRSRREPS